MEKLKVVIADDEIDAIEILRSILEDTGCVEIVSEITDPQKIESTLHKHKPDALFLDIEMPGYSGLDLLRNIREYNTELAVIYVTAYDKYIKDAIKLNVFTYLLKPVDRQEITELVDKLLAQTSKKKLTINQKLKLPIMGGYAYLKPSELFLLEAEGNYTRLKTIDGDEYVSSYNMGRLFQKLPSEMFFRINRSCVLNGEFIYKINKNQNTCQVKLNKVEFEFEVSAAFITTFNKATK